MARPDKDEADLAGEGLMPTILRRSGSDFLRADVLTTPRAMIHFCEDCGFEGAAFGRRDGDRILSFCGWVDGQPQCIGKGRAAPADLLGAA